MKFIVTDKSDFLLLFFKYMMLNCVVLNLTESVFCFYFFLTGFVDALRCLQ